MSCLGYRVAVSLGNFFQDQRVSVWAWLPLDQKQLTVRWLLEQLVQRYGLPVEKDGIVCLAAIVDGRLVHPSDPLCLIQPSDEIQIISVDSTWFPNSKLDDNTFTIDVGTNTEILEENVIYKDENSTQVTDQKEVCDTMTSVSKIISEFDEADDVNLDKSMSHKSNYTEKSSENKTIETNKLNKNSTKLTLDVNDTVSDSSNIDEKEGCNEDLVPCNGLPPTLNLEEMKRKALEALDQITKDTVDASMLDEESSLEGQGPSVKRRRRGRKRTRRRPFCPDTPVAIPPPTWPLESEKPLSPPPFRAPRVIHALN